jgi:hypothetical protein
MDVNDDEGCLDERGALASFASKLAPTGPVFQPGIVYKRFIFKDLP